MLPSKWSAFYSGFLFWVRTRELCNLRLLGGGGGHKNRGRGGFQLVSLRRCVRHDNGTRYLSRRVQAQTRRPFQFPCTQGTWDSSYVYHPGVRTCDRDCDPDVNPTFNMRNGLIHFCNHESTKSGEYNLGLLANNLIN